MNRRKRRSNPLLILVVLVGIAAMVYVNLVVIPETPPLFVPTATPTRDPGTIANEAADLFSKGKITQAIQAYEEAIRTNPKDQTNYIALARLQVFNGQLEEATTNIQNAILLNRDNALAQGVLGWVLGLQGDYLRSEGAFTRALELDPNNALTHAYYAEVLTMMAENDAGGLNVIDRAAEESRKAVQIDPNLLETRRARGIVLQATDNKDEAVVEFEAAVKLNNNIAELHLSLGDAYYVLERYTEAINEYITANSLNPQDSMPDYMISRTYAKAGEFPKAAQYAEQAVADDPSDPFLHGNLGSMYYKTGDLKKAITELRLAVRGGSTSEGVVVKGIPLDNTNRVVEFFSRYGLALAKDNQCDEAAQISQSITQNLPDDETALYNAGEMINICQQNLTGTDTQAPEENATATPVP